MNYRHAFHAGNFADVFKHVILSRILLYLGQKAAPYRLIDTHAGEGVYDLTGERAEKTAEWRGGIGRLIDSRPPADVAMLLAPYLDLVMPMLRRAPPLYPGSPAIAQRLARPQDRMIFCDVHPEVIAGLCAQDGIRRDKRVKILEIDGYQALNAFVPSPERRGLVLVDPPFESKTEFETLKAALALAVPKWPTGTYAIWYPVKDAAAASRFRKAVTAALPAWGVDNALDLRLAIAAPQAEGPLVATGFIILRPPFTLDVEARLILPYLAETMAIMGRGDFEVAWLIKH